MDKESKAFSQVIEHECIRNITEITYKKFVFLTNKTEVYKINSKSM